MHYVQALRLDFWTLQRHVLALYRTVIRKSRNVPDPSLAADVRRHARDEIDKYVDLVFVCCKADPPSLTLSHSINIGPEVWTRSTCSSLNT